MGLVTLNFDLLTLKLVCRSHVCWAISLPILVFLALLVLELFTMYATDRRTDGRTKATLNAPYPTGGGIIKLKNLLDSKGSRMMPPPNLQVKLRPPVTLNFDLLTPKLDRFMPSPRKPLVLICIEIGSVVFTARRVCIARTMPWQDVRLSIRPSVCLSHAGILSKRLYISLNFFHYQVAAPF